jgi:thiol:disulfide interchange protein
MTPAALRMLAMAAFAMATLAAPIAGADAPGVATTLAAAARFDPSRDAARDVADAVAAAKASGRRVLVDVGGEWCIWCHRLDAFFAHDDEARALRDRHYVQVKVNWSPENHNTAVLSRWPAIDGYPHYFVLDGDGALVRSQSTDALEKGHGYDRAKVMAFLARYAAPAGAKAASAALPR